MSSDVGEKLLLKSEYFLRLNNFLNNKKLLNTIKEKGYTLVFKPHPELINYMDLFDCNDENVIVSTEDSYQNLFNESSLLITDYLLFSLILLILKNQLFIINMLMNIIMIKVILIMKLWVLEN